MVLYILRGKIKDIPKDKPVIGTYPNRSTCTSVVTCFTCRRGVGENAMQVLTTVDLHVLSNRKGPSTQKLGTWALGSSNDSTGFG